MASQDQSTRDSEAPKIGWCGLTRDLMSRWMSLRLASAERTAAPPLLPKPSKLKRPGHDLRPRPEATRCRFFPDNRRPGIPQRALWRRDRRPRGVAIGEATETRCHKPPLL